LPVLFQRNHPQVWRVLQHHLCHQVSSNWPCLVFPCLFTNISAKFPIIIFWPAVFQKTGLSKINRFSCNLGSSRFDACSSQQP
jgi:hypothetical protein